MSPLRHIPARIQHWIVPYILIVLTLIAIGIAVTYRVESDSTDSAIRAAAIASCQRQNDVRAVADDAIATLADAQIDALRQQIKQSKALPPRFFPSIPPSRFHRLVRTQNRDRRSTIAGLDAIKRQAHDSFAPTHCVAVNS